MKSVALCIFDLDGVLVDTAGFHYQAWNRLARNLGFAISPEQNEELKGVGRRDSIEKIMKWGMVNFTESEIEVLMYMKNQWYLELVGEMSPSNILPGSRNFVSEIRKHNIKTALGSASRNARFILEKTGLTDYFDVIVDGNDITKAKPDPEIFLRGAEQLDCKPGECVVFEDAQAGIEAAKSANMIAVGLGQPEVLTRADWVIPSLENQLPGFFNFLSSL